MCFSCFFVCLCLLPPWRNKVYIYKYCWWVGGTTGNASDQQSTNDRKVAGLRPTKVVCIIVLTGNRMGWTARCGRPPLLLPSCRKLEFRLSALTDSDLAWVNGKNGRQSWRYADAFQRSIISEAIYHLPFYCEMQALRTLFRCQVGEFGSKVPAADVWQL